jgi:flotillin
MADEGVLLVVIVAFFLIIIQTFVIYARRYQRVGPDQAMVVYGRKRGDLGFQVVTSGGRFILPIVETVRFLSLEIRTQRVVVENVITRSGVPLTVDLVGQVRISNDPALLSRSAALLLSKTGDQVLAMTQPIIESSARAVCATLEVEQVNADRDAVSTRIREGARPALDELGIEIVSLTVRDISDNVGYLEGLGRQRIAQIKARAELGEKAAGALSGDGGRRVRVQMILDRVATMTDEEVDRLMRELEGIKPPASPAAPRTMPRVVDPDPTPR